MRESGAAQMRPRRLFSNQSPPIVGSSAENLRVSDPAWIGGVKVQTVFFFSQLIAVLAPAAFRYLQSCAFIPPVHGVLASSARFPSYLASIRRCRSGTGL